MGIVPSTVYINKKATHFDFEVFLYRQVLSSNGDVFFLSSGRKGNRHANSVAGLAIPSQRRTKDKIEIKTDG